MERFEGAQEAFKDGGPLRHHPKQKILTLKALQVVMCQNFKQLPQRLRKMKLLISLLSMCLFTVQWKCFGQQEDFWAYPLLDQKPRFSGEPAKPTLNALRLSALEVARGECETMQPHPRFQDARAQPSIQKRDSISCGSCSGPIPWRVWLLRSRRVCLRQ